MSPARIDLGAVRRHVLRVRPDGDAARLFAEALPDLIEVDAGIAALTTLTVLVESKRQLPAAGEVPAAGPAGGPGGGRRGERAERLD